MYTTKRFDNFIDFYEYNKTYINSNPLQNIFLIRVINSVFRGETTIYNFFNLIADHGQHVLVLIVEDFCLIYTDKYDSEFLNILSKELEFSKFNKYTFAGNKNAIENLLKFNNAKFSTDKHLSIYKCEKLSDNFQFSHGKARLANISELNQLAEFSVMFTKEYDGNEESLESMKLMITNAITNDCLYVWEDEQICAMAVIMKREHFDFPEIGHVYTPNRHRSKGYSSSLVFKMTEDLLNEYDFCMLYTNGENPVSNRVFVKIGYDKTGDYVRCFKEE